MNEKQIIQEAIELTKTRFITDTTGHDFQHMMRVFNNAKKIQAKEGGNLFVILLAALFHDFPDRKLTEDPESELLKLRKWMEERWVCSTDIQHVVDCILSVSYKNGENSYHPKTLEAKIVQDADRLDAIGAIGIARAMTFGGSHGRKLYNFSKPENTTVQHFYDKLLKLKDLMQTETGKKLAEERDHYMRGFLERLKSEIEGEL